MKSKPNTTPKQAETLDKRENTTPMTARQKEFPEIDPWFQEHLACLEPKEEEIPSCEKAWQTLQHHLPRQNRVSESFEHFVGLPPIEGEPCEAGDTSGVRSSGSFHERPPSRRGAGGRRLWMQGWSWGIVVATACFFLVVGMGRWEDWRLGASSKDTKKPVSAEYTGKGQALWSLLFARSTQAQQGYSPTQRAQDGQILTEGDLLQFAYQLQRSLHVVIVHLDAKGTITLCVSAKGKESLRLKAGQGTLPRGSSLELDGNLGGERLFVVTSTKRFSVVHVRKALQKAWKAQGRQLSKLTTFPGAWTVRSFFIRKMPRTFPLPKSVQPKGG